MGIGICNTSYALSYTNDILYMRFLLWKINKKESIARKGPLEGPSSGCPSENNSKCYFNENRTIYLSVSMPTLLNFFFFGSLSKKIGIDS